MPSTDDIFELLVRRGFVFPSSELYGGLSGFYEFGPVGSLVKRKITEAWRDWCVRREGFFEIDGSVIVRKEVLVASGHVKSFVDPIVKCQKCQEAFRADHLIEEQLKRNVDGFPIKELNEILSAEKIKCPSCGDRLPAAIDEFHMMFPVMVGAGKKSIEGYLRPETAQSIFVNFPRTFKATREKLPLGVAQLGKSFRNEISPRQGMIRMREFEQFEIEIFLDPEKLGEVQNWDELKATKVIFIREGEETHETVEELFSRGKVPTKEQAYWIAKEAVFYEKTLGIPSDKFRFRLLGKEETPFYSKGNIDMEVSTVYGWKETIGNAYRTDYDLSTHSKGTGKDFSVALPDGRKFIPHVIEPSWGLQRMFYCTLEHAFRSKGEAKGAEAPREWSWLALPAGIAPYSVHVFPLMRRDSLDDIARGIHTSLLKAGIDSLYDETGSIGKRYARADEIGCPFSITVDYDSKDKGDVTVRERDSTLQTRVPIKGLAEFILQKLREGAKQERI